MQISITGRHMDISDTMREHIHGKLEQTFAEFPRIESVHVILDLQKYLHMAEVVLQAPHHIRIEAKHTSEDMYASIDESIDKAAKQLRRTYDKVQDHKSHESLGELEAETLLNENPPA